MQTEKTPLKTSVEIIKNSINEFGHQIITFKLTYHRFILSELNTHRVFSRNSASSRAIPIEKQIEYVKNNTAYPVFWGKNQRGMQSKEEINDIDLARYVWNKSRNNNIESVNELLNLNLHKQLANRLLEPYTYIQTILTGTEFNNFFNLRNHEDAQPEIKLLASLMYEEYIKSEPIQLSYDQWHLPYIDCSNGEYYLDGNKLNKKDAIKTSISCVAQISYRKLDNSLEKADNIYNRLVTSYPIHASPTEHIATPFSHKEYNLRKRIQEQFIDELDFEEDKNNEIDIEHFMYKRNFKGWTQFRVGIPKETCLVFK
jgi:thymidylate synthase ThyX